MALRFVSEVEVLYLETGSLDKNNPKTLKYFPYYLLCTSLLALDSLHVGTRVSIGPQYPFLSHKATKWVGFIWNRKTRGPVSQQVWHDKDPSPLNGHKRGAKPFIANGDVSMRMKYFRAGN